MYKTALVHDWLVTHAGAELFLNYLYTVYPSPIYTLFCDKKIQQGEFLKGAEIHTSSLQRIPGITKHYRKLLSLFPEAIEEFNLNEFDIILSSSHCVAKGVLTTGKQLHISYIHSPIRYAWDMHFSYLDLQGYRGLKRHYARKVLHRIRTWDVISSPRVDHFVANSKYIARRINRVYNRPADVIYPPVNISDFPYRENKDNYYVAASRFVQYKRMDLIVGAFTRMPDKKLVVIGGGPDKKKLQKIAAKSPNITILDYIPFAELREALAGAKAFLFASEEDFGALPVQAQACGTPIIAYGVGGAMETVIPGKTGLHFFEQSEQAIREAVQAFESRQDAFDPAEIRKNAERFTFEIFKEKMTEYVEEKARLKFQ